MCNIGESVYLSNARCKQGNKKPGHSAPALVSFGNGHAGIYEKVVS
jgi:hypothetical protein